jgi:hypothetical protein
MSIDPSRALASCAVPLTLCLLAACSSPQTRVKPGAPAGDPGQALAVFSKARNGYVRAKAPDGTLRPESYVLEAGVRANPGESSSYERLSLEDVAAAIANPLAIQNYMPSGDPDSTDLLILVYWGSTLVPDDIRPYENRASTKEGAVAKFNYEHSGNGSGGKNVASASPVAPPATEAAISNPDYVGQLTDQQLYNATEGQGLTHGASITSRSFVMNEGSPQEEVNRSLNLETKQDSLTDSRNAAILGYADTILAKKPVDRPLAQLITELEQHRYYVVLLAYDYRTARQFGKHRLLWEARFSIPGRGNDFEKSIAAMALAASSYFGRDSNGLIHSNLKEGHVEVGEPKALDTVP